MGLSGGSGSFQRHVATAPARGKARGSRPSPRDNASCPDRAPRERERERGEKVRTGPASATNENRGRGEEEEDDDEEGAPGVEQLFDRCRRFPRRTATDEILWAAVLFRFS
ncbi:hypothetical protein ACJRO7_024602 [Eucalyptus globulus]|uniref:Uncharacterized protein n=1 Tax=Eucalyptus globulus TaxID=34317 RepID=A0ABD3K6I5_EUCGL